jgi:hypothetical protein
VTLLELVLLFAMYTYLAEVWSVSREGGKGEGRWGGEDRKVQVWHLP